MSRCDIAMVAAQSAVAAPTVAITICPVGLSSRMAAERASKYTPRRDHGRGVDEG